MAPMARAALIVLGLLVAASLGAQAAPSLSWKGLTWVPSSGTALGETTPGQVAAAAENVKASTGLELALTLGSPATGAEAKTVEPYWFGTFTWDLEGPIANGDASAAFTVGLSSGSVPGEDAILVHFTRWGSDIASGDGARIAVYPSTGHQYTGQISSWESSLNAAFDQDRIRVVLTWTSTRVSVKVLNRKGKVLDSAEFRSDDPEVEIPQTPLPLVVRLWNFGPPPQRPLTMKVVDFQYQSPKG